ncbi:MAG: PHB depolymerase family esterase [Candidatus Omnitrophota bacterium]
MEKHKAIIAILSILFVFSSSVSAQNILKEKIKKRPQEKKEKSYGADDPEFSLAHDGIIRKYKVHLPPAYDGKTIFAVVIYIHGGSGDMRAVYMDGVDKAADKFGFILAVPEGTGELTFGHLRGVWNGGKWATGECCGSADDVGFISKMIDELKAKFKVDARRIYATGISNGGLMTNRLGCELSEKIAAIATVTPAAVKSECQPSRSMPVMNIHGTADPANPPDGSEPRSIFAKDSGTGFAMPYQRMTPYQVVDVWKKINQCSDKQVAGYENGAARCVIYNDCAQGSEVVLCMVEGMGHAYPSGAQYLPANMVGPVSCDISFEQIWEFFKKHSLK